MVLGDDCASENVFYDDFALRWNITAINLIHIKLDWLFNHDSQRPDPSHSQRYQAIAIVEVQCLSLSSSFFIFETQTASPDTHVHVYVAPEQGGEVEKGLTIWYHGIF